jgi:hypothetical protein
VIDPRVFEAIAQASPEDCPPLLAALVARVAQCIGATRSGASPAPTGGPDQNPTSIDSPSLLTYQDAAKLLRCSASYVETLVRQGKLPHVRLPAADKAGRSRAGRMVRLCASDLELWARKHRS